MLTDDADVAAWQNEGLPADRVSMENATILTNCERWPLMVDPQLQGIKWLKNTTGLKAELLEDAEKTGLPRGLFRSHQPGLSPSRGDTFWL